MRTLTPLILAFATSVVRAGGDGSQHNSQYSSQYSSQYGPQYSSPYGSQYGSQYSSLYSSQYNSQYSSQYSSESSFFTPTTYYPTGTYYSHYSEYSYSYGACPTVIKTAAVCSSCPVPQCQALSTLTNYCHCPTEIPTTYIAFGCETACADMTALGCGTTYEYATGNCVSTGIVTSTKVETTPTFVTGETAPTSYTGFANSTAAEATSTSKAPETASSTGARPSEITAGAARIVGNVIGAIAGVAALLL